MIYIWHCHPCLVDVYRIILVKMTSAHGDIFHATFACLLTTWRKAISEVLFIMNGCWQETSLWFLKFPARNIMSPDTYDENSLQRQIYTLGSWSFLSCVSFKHGLDDHRDRNYPLVFCLNLRPTYCVVVFCFCEIAFSCVWVMKEDAAFFFCIILVACSVACWCS